MYSSCYGKEGNIIPYFEPPTFLKGGVNLNYLPQELGGGGCEKLKKGVLYGAGAGLLKREGDWHISHLFFFLGLPFLHLEITLFFAKLSYAFEEKLFFSATISLWKSHSKLSKNEPENIPKIKIPVTFVKGFKRLKIDFW